MDGAEIRTLRKQLGLTQEEFAHEIGVTFATVNRWENKKSEPSRLALKMLAAEAGHYWNDEPSIGRWLSAVADERIGPGWPL